MKKKTFLGILSGLLVIVIVSTIYIVSGSQSRKNHVIEYLQGKGYSASEIQDVRVSYSFLNAVLGYQKWQINVVFEDEPSVVYQYSYRDGQILQRGFTGGNDDMGKKELIRSLKHLEK